MWFVPTDIYWQVLQKQPSLVKQWILVALHTTSVVSRIALYGIWHVPYIFYTVRYFSGASKTILLKDYGCFCKTCQYISVGTNHIQGVQELVDLIHL